MSKSRKTVIIAALIIVLFGGATVLAVDYARKESSSPPIVFSSNKMLYEMWNSYKQDYLEPGTFRTLDKQSQNITTSEGQSYTMLRSVWMDDRTTFDKSWQWTKDNLQREDSLFSWKFGRIKDKDYGVLVNEGGNNTATDGDEDIALSLLMAYNRWNESKYLDAAKPIISSIWEKEVISIKGKPVLLANDIERNSEQNVLVNPSYFAPYAYKTFALVDKKHDWKGLADNSYELLTNISSNPLDTGKSNSMPPNWAIIDRTNGTIKPAQAPLTSHYSYDALRVPWRLALDYEWYEDERAKNVLSTYGFLDQFWNDTKVLNAEYAHDGSVVADYEVPAMYGGSLGYFDVIKPETADEIYTQKLEVLYDPNAQASKEGLGYYDSNWVWFGMALHNHTLPNLTVER